MAKKQTIPKTKLDSLLHKQDSLKDQYGYQKNQIKGIAPIWKSDAATSRYYKAASADTKVKLGVVNKDISSELKKKPVISKPTIRTEQKPKPIIKPTSKPKLIVNGKKKK